MSDVTTAHPVGVGGTRSTHAQRRYWRGLNTMISGVIGAVVVVSAVVLGVTAPLVSPVTPPAPAAVGTAGGAPAADPVNGGGDGLRGREGRFEGLGRDGRFGGRPGRGR